MGIIEDLQRAQEKARRNGTKNAKFIVNRRTYEALCRQGVDGEMLIVSDVPKDGDCVMVKETPGTYSPASLPQIKEPEKKGWEPIEKKRSSRATKKKYRYKKRKK
ncbi:hypothetical protein AALB52_01380 [Lachnospiraceae bacterium 38-14]